MEFLKAVGKEIYEGGQPILLRGFGLGGWLLPEGYMWKLYTKCDRPRRMEEMIEKLCGKVYAESFWQQYLKYYITEKDIEMIAGEGFNSVRLPLNARHLYEKRNHELTINSELFSLIDQLIDWCKKHHIYLILDMHGAPGGQTGQNIDDSEADQPYLFMDCRYEEELVFLWKELAKRYHGETIIAGYDLLNEPLPNFFCQYNDKVLPLYRRLIREIREIDKNHMIILEGVHWASDFSVFEEFTKEEAADNIMLQFHKYWNNPDAESIDKYIQFSNKLQIPLFMGEGGENNCDWYTTVFPLFEQLNISWSFWSYKKMDCNNSPVTFDVPEGWEELMDWIDGKGELSSDRAIAIFDQFLLSIQNFGVNTAVWKALKREAPVTIPCEAYDTCSIKSDRIPGAKLRMTEPVSIIFENGRVGEVNYKRYGGEEQPAEENLLVWLFAQDSVGYRYVSDKKYLKVVLRAEGKGNLQISGEFDELHIPIEGKAEYTAIIRCSPEVKNVIRLTCMDGDVKLDYVRLD